MNKSDEFIDLEKRFCDLKENGSLSGEALDFAEKMLELIKKNEARLSDIEDRLMKLEDFSDIISVDVYNVQSEFLKHIGVYDEEDEDEEDDDDGGHFLHHHHHDGCDCDECSDHDDGKTEDGSSFVRCPFCNTLIFINDNDEELTCPFCGEDFLRSDVVD